MNENQNNMKNTNAHQEKIVESNNNNKYDYVINIIKNMIIFDLIYLIIGVLLILILLPNKTTNSIGFMVGVIISIGFSLITKQTIILSLKDKKNFSFTTIVVTYITSLLLIFAVLYVMYVFDLGNLFAALAGLVSFSFSLMFQSRIGKIIKNKFGNKI